MRRLLALLLVTLAGCSSTTRITADSAPAVSANISLIGESVTVRLTDGRRHEGRFLGLYPDSTAWLDPSGERVQVPTREVTGVTRLSRWDGFWKGALIGGVATGLTVATLAYADFGTEEWGYYEPIKGPFIVTLGFLYGGMAAVPGGLVGAAVGSRERYVVDAPAPADSALVFRRAAR